MWYFTVAALFYVVIFYMQAESLQNPDSFGWAAFLLSGILWPATLAVLLICVFVNGLISLAKKVADYKKGKNNDEK